MEDTRVGLVTVHLQEGREEGKVAEVKTGDWENTGASNRWQLEQVLETRWIIKLYIFLNEVLSSA